MLGAVAFVRCHGRDSMITREQREYLMKVEKNRSGGKDEDYPCVAGIRRH